MNFPMQVLACPHCARHFRLSPGAVGKTIRCRGCRQLFFIPEAAKPPSSYPNLGRGVLRDPVQARFQPAQLPSPPRASAAVVDGIDARICPTCGHSFAMRHELEGKTIRCRGCRSLFIVAAGPPAPPLVPALSRTHEQSPVHAVPPVQRIAVVDDSSDNPIARHDTRGPNGTGGSPLVEQPTIFDDVGDILDRMVAGGQCPAAIPMPRRSATPVDGEHPLSQFIAVVAGGAIALPISQLILWWCLGSDPLSMAPLLPRALAWMAPAEFRE